MKIIIIALTGSYIDDDIEEAFSETGDVCIRMNLSALHAVEKKYDNPPLERELDRRLEAEPGLCVFTTNFHPVVARVCHRKRIVYLAWQNDTPPNRPTEQERDHPTNRIFFFNKTDCDFYRNKGLEHIYYLPMAVNTKRLSDLSKMNGTLSAYRTEVSLVGQLYMSTLPMLKEWMNPYEKGWIEGLIAAQNQVYSDFFIEELLTPEFMESVNAGFAKKQEGLSVNKRQLSFSIATYLTYVDRISLLSVLSQRFHTDLYTDKIGDAERLVLGKTRIHGPVDYKTQMPLVFKASKINLCPVLRNNTNAIPLRAVDVMGSGGFLMTNFHMGMAEAFEDGKEFVMYHCVEEAVDLAGYYLEHDDQRQKIAENGFAKMEKEYRYRDRILALKKSVVDH